MMEYITNLKEIKPEDLEGFFIGWKKPLTIYEHYEMLKNSSYIVIAYDTEESKVVGFINELSDRINFAFIPMIEVLPEYQHKELVAIL